MLLGCHLSISDGLDKAIDKAEALEINALQIFSHSARSWRMSPLDYNKARRFIEKRKNIRIEYVVIHTGYLINLASPKEALYKLSIQALKEEIKRAGELGIPHVNTHIGAHVGAGEEYGLKRVAQALNRILSSPEAQAAPYVKILLENSSGEGTELGARLDEFAFILDNMKDMSRIGVCMDTCHAFSAGYDITKPDGLEGMLNEIKTSVGLERLKLIHLNDSKHELGSRKDRHEHIGRGFIGLEGFKLVINHPLLRELPFILETPKELNEKEKLDSRADRMNLDTVRSLRKERGTHEDLRRHGQYR